MYLQFAQGAGTKKKLQNVKYVRSLKEPESNCRLSKRKMQIFGRFATCLVTQKIGDQKVFQKEFGIQLQQ